MLGSHDVDGKAAGKNTTYVRLENFEKAKGLEGSEDAKAAGLHISRSEIRRLVEEEVSRRLGCFGGHVKNKSRKHQSRFGGQDFKKRVPLRLDNKWEAGLFIGMLLFLLTILVVVAVILAGKLDQRSISAYTRNIEPGDKLETYKIFLGQAADSKTCPPPLVYLGNDTVINYTFSASINAAYKQPVRMWELDPFSAVGGFPKRRNDTFSADPTIPIFFQIFVRTNHDGKKPLSIDDRYVLPYKLKNYTSFRCNSFYYFFGNSIEDWKTSKVGQIYLNGKGMMVTEPTIVYTPDGKREFSSSIVEFMRFAGPEYKLICDMYLNATGQRGSTNTNQCKFEALAQHWGDPNMFLTESVNAILLYYRDQPTTIRGYKYIQIYSPTQYLQNILAMVNGIFFLMNFVFTNAVSVPWHFKFGERAAQVKRFIEHLGKSA
eukprot:jgi/Bigna1/87689/estExt_fgenesh1_pg.C_230058